MAYEVHLNWQNLKFSTVSQFFMRIFLQKPGFSYKNIIYLKVARILWRKTFIMFENRRFNCQNPDFQIFSFRSSNNGPDFFHFTFVSDPETRRNQVSDSWNSVFVLLPVTHSASVTHYMWVLPTSLSYPISLEVFGEEE